MPLDQIAESTGLIGWIPDNSLLSRELQRTETLIALAVAGSLLVLWTARRARQTGDGRFQQSEFVPVRVTASGPIRVGLEAQISVVGDRTITPIEGVVEFLDKRQLTFEVDISQASRVRAGTVVEAMMASASTGYRFIGTVQDCRRSGNALLLCFQCPEWVERVQRRSFYRVPIHCPATVTCLDQKSATDAPVRSILTELSGGGVTIRVPLCPAVGSLLRVRTAISQLGESSYEVRVLRSSPIRLVSVKMWEVGCEFLWMGEAERERIARACFEIQRADRAREEKGARRA